MRDWPIDVLKIDSSFNFALTSEFRNLAIVSYFVSIANMLGLKTVAEDAEQVEVAKVLQSMGLSAGSRDVFRITHGCDAAFELVSGLRLPAAE